MKMYFGSRHKALQASHYCSNIKEVSLFGDFVISIIQCSQDKSELVLQQFSLSTSQKPELQPFQTIPLDYSVKALEILLCHPNKCFALILTDTNGWKEATIHRPSHLTKTFTFSVQREIQPNLTIPVSCCWSRNGAEYVVLFADGGILLRSYFKNHDIAYFHPYGRLAVSQTSQISADLSPDGLILATLYPTGGRATLWNVAEPEMTCIGDLDVSLITKLSAGAPYLGKFSRVEGLAHRYHFIAVHAIQMKSDTSQSCLVVWEPQEFPVSKTPSKFPIQLYQPIRAQKLPRVLKGRHTCLAVSQGGRYVAVGNADGGVVVYDAYYLRKVHIVKGSIGMRGHQAAITNLHFLSQKSTEQHDHNFELFSFSDGDQYLMWHAAAPRKDFFILLIFFSVLSGIFIFLYFFSMLGL